jgi:hypothetical protein
VATNITPPGKSRCILLFATLIHYLCSDLSVSYYLLSIDTTNNCTLLTSHLASPCGMCRQFIREFCDLDLPVFMNAGDGSCVVLTLDELLPMSFSGREEGGFGVTLKK